MNSRYFSRLALQNIDRHRQTFVPYMIAVSSFVSMFYMLLFLRKNVFASHEINDVVFDYLLSGAAYVFGFFVVIFLIFTNSYLMRPRAKEFGLLYLFGLSQRHLIIITIYEVMVMYAMSIVFGLISGIVMSRLMSMVLSALIKVPLMMKQIVDIEAVRDTSGLFVGTMGIVLVINIIQLMLAKPMSLMQPQNNVKSKQIRRYVLLGIGLLSIGYAYSAILTVDSSQKAYESLAIIILTIVIGTYCLFVSLSESIVHIVAQRPSVYYQTDILITINGLLSRIRMNAIGLANVSMFALVILIMVSLSVVVYFGANESVQKIYAADVIVTVQNHNIRSKTQLQEFVMKIAREHGVTATPIVPYTFVSVATNQTGNVFTYQMRNQVFVGSSTSHYFVLFTLDEYNRIYGESLELATDEVAVYSSYTQLPDTFVLQGNTYHVVKRLSQLSVAHYDLEQLVNAHYVVVHDASILNTHELNKFLQSRENPSPIRYRFGLDMIGTEAQKLATFKALKDALETTDVISHMQRFPNEVIEVVNIQSRQAEKILFEGVYGTFLFLGLFLGMLFVMSTALLIYYKQLSEGYEDKTRFDILQRIGMTQSEVRNSVDKQIVVFFSIPLIVAGMHFGVSLHLIRYLLELFRIENMQLMISAALVTFMVFSLIYLVIYRVSARVYYNIVR